VLFLRPECRVWLGLAALTIVVLGPFMTPARAQSGLAANSVGPINMSMGGAATAAPLDSAGALYWNPATIGEIANEMEVGAGILIPRSTLSSKIGPGALGNGIPPVPLSGTTGSNTGVFILPTVGIVYTPTESPWSFGFGIFEIGGFGVNYPVDPKNPILNPQVPFGRGIGPLYAQLQLLQFSPTVAVKLTDTLSVGAQANIDYGLLGVNPGLFSAPGLENSPLGPGPVYSYATQGRSRAGGGFQLGVYWQPEGDWSFGASYKSTQWFERYTFNSVNPTNGNPASPNFALNFPETVSAGFAYKGIDRLLLATDFRFLDYRDTSGFSQNGFNAQGALRGLGWQNIFALGTGAQYQATDDLTLRIGYTFNMNPIGNAVTSYNVANPLVIMHTIALGASYNVTKNFKVSFAYSHFFQNEISGPLIEPFVGAVPHSSVRTTATADIVQIGATVSF
jgi:long-chain fatty acid transport protein